MATGTHSESGQIGSCVFNRTVSSTANNFNIYGDATSPITLAAGLTVTAWVKNAAAAACNLPSGHGWGASAVVDVYDADGTLYYYGVTATITANAAALAGGTMVKAYPDSATPGVIVCKQQQVNVDIDGDNASQVQIMATVLSHADFQDSSSGSVRPLTLLPNDADIWDSYKAVNPYTGNVISKVLVSNGTTTAGTLQIAVLQDATP